MFVVEELVGGFMGEFSEAGVDLDMAKKVSFAISSSSVSDSSCDTALPRQLSVHGRTTGPTRRSTKGGWTEEEDIILAKVVNTYRGRNWKKIAEHFPGRSDVQCLHRWQKVLNPDLVKGPWTKEEDDRIIELVGKYGSKKWSVIAQSLPGRIGKQCRERWHNHLNPSIKKDAWTKEEELALIRAHQIYGNKWAEIARFLPGRADNSIKNHWNCSVKKKLDSYAASGLAGDIPSICIADSNADVLNPGVSTLSLGMLGFPGKETDAKDGINTGLVFSVLGNSKGEEIHLHTMPSRIENSRILKEADNRQRSSTGVQCDEKLPPSNLINERPRVDENHGSVPDSLYRSPIHLKVSHGISAEDSQELVGHINCASPICYPGLNSTAASSSMTIPTDLNYFARRNFKPADIVLPQIADKLRPFPEKPFQFSSSISGSSHVDSRANSECDNLPSSSPINKFCAETSQVCGQGKVSVAHLQSEETSSHNLYYHSPQLKGVEAVNTKNSQPTLGFGCFSTPPSSMSIYASEANSDPDSILRKAAKSFSTPSIMRKRKRVTSRVIAGANCFIDLSTPDAKDVQDSTHSCPPHCGAHDDLTSMDLSNVKWLSLSSQSPSGSKTVSSSKSLEKRLEHEFDMAWDNFKAKGSTSATPSESSDANHGSFVGFIPVNSPDSLGVGPNENSMQVDSDVNCNSTK
ncbi:hypothetical protein Sjap_020619 [Stephania japonica]|uniref:Uncharacterized protein n=1 Tax=Stephania japonica TaxID=461633 RepID=A0AAP0I0K3_9MAGN